ncbi:MAG: nonstructural protein [Arizlama microvirus]|nr:MAG: nonstructural protein [Arizlama microvirus]
MNTVNAYCVLDRKAKIYNTPYFIMNDAVAIRQFSMVVNGQDSMVAKFPEDYILYRVGSFDMLEGKINPEPFPVEVTTGNKVKKAEV